MASIIFLKRRAARECETGIIVLDGARPITGQIEQVRDAIAEPPAVLVGWSWGAMLGAIVAGEHPELVRKLVLVASRPFASASSS